MSAFQRAQMYSLTDPNIFNIAIEGTFDDCQDVVKAVNADAAFKAKHSIGAVNSINWARVVAQVVEAGGTGWANALYAPFVLGHAASSWVRYGKSRPACHAD
jgi:hypothetical protein